MLQVSEKLYVVIENCTRRHRDIGLQFLDVNPGLYADNVHENCIVRPTQSKAPEHGQGAFS